MIFRQIHKRLDSVTLRFFIWVKARFVVCEPRFEILGGARKCRAVVSPAVNTKHQSRMPLAWCETNIVQPLRQYNKLSNDTMKASGKSRRQHAGLINSGALTHHGSDVQSNLGNYDDLNCSNKTEPMCKDKLEICACALCRLIITYLLSLNLVTPPTSVDAASTTFPRRRS